jgi:hypothetical protein
MQRGQRPAGLVPALEVHRTAPIADLGHAATERGRDGSRSPDVSAFWGAGVGVVVPLRLIPRPVKHRYPVSTRPGGASA